jgi:oligosaccharide repeat unit polymerase
MMQGKNLFVQNVEIILPLAVISVTYFGVLTAVVSLEFCIWIAVTILCYVFFLSWRQLGRGRHPCFLFLAMLLIFQGGRLLGFALGTLDSPLQIDLMTEYPIGVSHETAELTLLTVTLSAILIYAPCRIAPYISTQWPKGDESWLPALYALIVLTLPFAVYKDLNYFLFIRSHGGYLAVYTDNAAVLQTAGPLIRAISTVSSTAVLTTYIFERKPRRIRLLLFLFFFLSGFDLLLGFRGKFFAEALSIWFLHNLRSGRSFKLVPLAATALTISMIAVVTADLRENRNIVLLSPIGFVITQGVSLNVTESAIEFGHFFSQFGWSYAWNGFLNGISPIAQGDGKLLTWDLTQFLSPPAAASGFGTASSYLAELYLIAGLPAVAIGSLLIGYLLRTLYRFSGTMWGILVLAYILPGLIYLPRLELLAPLAELLKSLISLSIIAAFAFGYKACSDLSRSATMRNTRHGARASIARGGH